MKIVFLDAKTIGEDIDLSGYETLGEVVKYGFTNTEDIPARVEDADVLVSNKIEINRDTIGSANKLKLVCVTATGTNNLDKEYLDYRKIAWRNVAGYSTESVTQHTFAMLFYLMENLKYYDEYVKTEQYVNDEIFTHFGSVFHELSGKTMGIIGLGAIGRRVSDIAQLFGATVIYYSASGSSSQPGYQQVDFDTLLSKSDIISIHAPLNEYTESLINSDALSKMKPTAILLNLGRGGIIVEEDLASALENNIIYAAGLDVLAEEPMRENCAYRRIKDSRKLLITPHIAWASIESRTRLMDIILGQIKEFFI